MSPHEDERPIATTSVARIGVRATHRNRKRVAIKMLHPELSVHPEARERFLREGYAANTVGHPGAVAVDDEDVAEDGAAFLVMELLEGESLASRAERAGGRLPLGEVLRAADQVLDVLAAAHAKTIVHRDLKPDNLFLTRTGEIKVLDFGIARVREAQSSASARPGHSCGEPVRHPGPERIRSRDFVDRSTSVQRRCQGIHIAASSRGNACLAEASRSTERPTTTEEAPGPGILKFRMLRVRMVRAGVGLVVRSPSLRIVQQPKSGG